MKNPAGTFSFVGNVPATLYDNVPATKNDILGGNCYRLEDGRMYSPRIKICPTLDDALKLVKDLNIEETYNVIIHGQ